MSDARESAPAGRPAPRPAGASVGQAGAAGWPVLHLFFRIDRVSIVKAGLRPVPRLQLRVASSLLFEAELPRLGA